MSTLLAGFDGVVDIITGTLGMIIYPLFSIIFVLISGVQHVFEAFAGIGEMSFGGQNIGNGNTGSETDTGIVFYLLNYPLVKNMLISIMVLAIFLIVIFTAMAFIKNVYAAKSKNWKEIITFSIKGLANFFFIPVCCLLGIWLGNILLQAINGATSDGGAHYMDRKLFIASAYNANKYRAGEASGPSLAREAYTWGYGSGAESAVPDGLSDEEYAVILDKVYSETNVDIWTHGVGRHYVLWQVNYIVLVAGGIFMLYALGSLAFAMVKRLFYIVVLFVISPAICALYPIDEGKAVGSWKDEFVKQVVSAYGAVAGLNIFFSLIPLIDNIQLFSGDWYAKGFGINDIAQIFVLTAGLIVVKDLIGLLSGFFSKGENAFSTGSALMKDSKGKVLAGTKKAQKYAGVFSMPIQSAAKGVWGAAQGAGKIVKGLGKDIGGLAKKGADAVGLTDAYNNFNDERQRKKDEKATEKANKAAEKAQNKRDKAVLKYAKKHSDIFGTYGGDGKLHYDLKDAAGVMDFENEDKAKKKAENKAKWAARGQSVKDGLGKVGSKIKNSEFGKAVAEETKNAKEGGKKFLGGLKDFGSAIYEETGMKKTVEDAFGAGEFGATRKRYADRTKARKEGVVGEGKIKEEIAKARTKYGEGITATEVLDASGSASDILVKRLGKSEKGKEKLEALGLGEKATKAEITNIDAIMSKISSLQDRIKKTEGDARKALLEELKKTAISTDTNGNTTLQNALNDVLKVAINTPITGKVDLNEETVNQLKKASKEAADAMADDFTDNMKDVVEEIKKDKEKNKS